MATSSSLDVTKKRRLNASFVACPVVYGSVCFYLGKKADEFATHRWTLFIRGPNDEDLSVFVSKVAFSLHESFAESVRVITSPPFEVTEHGWGEFTAKIRIFFRDPEEQPIDVSHTIKLYPPGMTNSSLAHQNLKKPVVAEVYDEIVFAEPTAQFRELLMRYVPPSVRPALPLSEFYTNFDEERDVHTLTTVLDHLVREIDQAKNRLLQLETELSSPSSSSLVATSLP